mmetsp:Transcript_11239/g.19939  ORF Transcript_11239/g.19939 Transcript_11239/m.19939 type:complete len:135 (+) Transcript_11239:57-461(+)
MSHRAAETVKMSMKLNFILAWCSMLAATTLSGCSPSHEDDVEPFSESEDSNTPCRFDDAMKNCIPHDDIYHEMAPTLSCPLTDTYMKCLQDHYCCVDLKSTAELILNNAHAVCTGKLAFFITHTCGIPGWPGAK